MRLCDAITSAAVHGNKKFNFEILENTLHYDTYFE